MAAVQCLRKVDDVQSGCLALLVRRKVSVLPASGVLARAHVRKVQQQEERGLVAARKGRKRRGLICP